MLPFSSDCLTGEFTSQASEWGSTRLELQHSGVQRAHRMPPDEPNPAAPERVVDWQVHHLAFGEALLEAAGRLGVEAYLEYPGPGPKYADLTEFLLVKLAGE